MNHFYDQNVHSNYLNDYNHSHDHDDHFDHLNHFYNRNYENRGAVCITNRSTPVMSTEIDVLTS